MTRTSFCCALSVWGAALVWPASAQVSDAVMQDAFRRAIEIVEAHSSYRNIPSVRFWVKVPDGDMGRMAVRAQTVGNPNHVVAIYVCAEKAMYLSESLDPSDPEQLGIVVHEMVHHAQCEAGRYTVDLCPAEREAYRIQAAYYRDLVVRRANGRATASADADLAARALEATGEAACRAARNR